MNGSTDQIAGAVFRTLTQRGHEEVERAPIVGHEPLPHAFENVLENAVEHNDATHPHVAVDLAPPATDGGRFEVRIADDGPGLPPVERQVLRTAEETQLTHSTGLGLWFTNWIVRGSSGRIDVDCDNGGTTVVVELPARPRLHEAGDAVGSS